MISLGLRAHDYGTGTPAHIAQKLAAYKPDCIQLALAKSFPFIQEKPGQITPGLAQHIRDAFAQYHINIAVLGCYINPIHPDPKQKELSLQRFEEHLRFARDFGCAIVGTETGSCNADCSYHPKSQSESAFLELVDSIRRLADTAEKYGTIVGIEGVAHHHTIHSYEKMVRLLELVNSANVQVIYDPVNFFPLGQCTRQHELMEKAFEMFGDKIVAVHCKDFVIENGKKEGDLPSGTGEFDHAYLLNWLAREKPLIHTILENTNSENIHQVQAFMRHQLKNI
ncbi:sugar phosphate isomerase/epimerase family protein [Catenovulum sediminis]|uniref:sugar phosphate isomerase/epimerase family protein n=1 Tax=Catenovulum sediminis TaxID=1740262 RepID=UPI001180E847|nr:sugar phosphate isomerase/epimerase family protein [Catenovulum sediminis]